MSNTAELDRTLLALARSPSYDTRVIALRQLVEYWHGPIRPDDGYAPAELAGLQLPKALYWWYSWAGKRTEITSGDGQFIGPEIPNSPDEFGRIYCWNENQGVFQRAVSAAGDDPPVYQSDWNGGDEWKLEGMTLLELLMQLCVFEAQSDYWGFLDVVQPQLDAFAVHVPRLPVVPWQTWDTDYKFAIDFHVGRGIYAIVHDLIGAYTLTVRSKSPDELQFLDEFLPRHKWEVREF